MKISTAEIKMLIRECVSDGGIYTSADFSDFICKNSGKEHTRGQLAGGLAQLVDSGEVVRIDRGLYQKNAEKKSNPVNKTEKTVSEKERLFNKEATECLDQVEKTLSEFSDSRKIWELDNEQFEILIKMRALKEQIEKIRRECK